MDSIDVSIGLSSTLQLLAQYHQSGALQAKIPHLPVLRGSGIGVIEVIGGKIVSCFIQNMKGERRFLMPDKLIHFDKSKGPFEWRFYAQKLQKNIVTSPLPQKQPQAVRSQLPARDDIPQAVANLNVDALGMLSSQQKRALRMTFAMIDGQRTVQTIEAYAPLPKGAVYEAIMVLIAMRVIVVKAAKAER